MPTLTRAIAAFALSLVFVMTAQAASTGGNLCSISGQRPIAKVDMDRVRSTWLGWYNDLRVSRGLAPYSYNDALTRTATAWSNEAALKGSISHKRAASDPYYNYKGIQKWFSDLGVTFKNISKTTFTENIGWGVTGRCRKKDCTDDFLKSIRTTFDFYVAEEGKASRSHWNSIVKPHFKEVGLGVAVRNGKYYLTMHFGTDVTANAEASCVAKL